MKQIIISFIFFLILSNCTRQTNKNAFVTDDVKNCKTLNLVKRYYLDKDSIALLEVLRDENENYILLQTKLHGKILSVSGTGNIDFLDGALRLDTVFFEKDKEVFILPTYVYGSTYGAVVYFLIYEDNYPNNWEITKIPFDRLEIKTDKNRLSNVLFYTSDNRCIKYIFKNGILQQIK